MQPERRRRRTSVARSQLIVTELVELLQVKIARFVPKLQECF